VADLTDVEAVSALSEDPRLAELGEHASPLSLFRTFRLQRNEVEHSRLLAVLFESEPAPSGIITRWAGGT
jgi:hypothetical protein